MLPLLGWWTTGLMDLDEGFYGAIVAEMNRRGEWITPYFNGHPWFEKPILLYWLAKPCMLLFGPIVGPRLPSVLLTVAIYAVVAWFARRRLNDAVAQMTVLILASSLLFVAVGRMMMTDVPLVFCLTVAFLTFWESLRGPSRWRWVTAVALGGGVLAKGPVALILFGLVIGWMYARHRELRPAFRGSWPTSLLLLGLTIATWYVPAYLANGQVFVQKFLVEQNLNRFTGGDAAHTLGLASLPFFIPILLLGMFPWSLWIPKVFLRRDSDDPALRSYLVTWSVVVFVFFSLSGAKLVHYILPMFPPMAMLIAAQLQAKTAWPRAVAWTCAMACIANVGFVLWDRSSGEAEAHELAREVHDLAGQDAVAVYEMNRREASLGTGTLDLKETSLPSLLLYLDRTVIEADDDDPAPGVAKFADLVRHPGPVWIVTRVGRIGPSEVDEAAAQGRFLEEVRGDWSGEHFRLYRLR